MQTGAYRRHASVTRQATKSRRHVDTMHSQHVHTRKRYRMLLQALLVKIFKTRVHLHRCPLTSSVHVPVQLNDQIGGIQIRLSASFGPLCSPLSIMDGARLSTFSLLPKERRSSPLSTYRRTLEPNIRGKALQVVPVFTEREGKRNCRNLNMDSASIPHSSRS